MGLKWDGTIRANTVVATLPWLILGLIWAVRLEGRLNTEVASRRARDASLTGQIAAVHAEDDARMRGIRDLLLEQTQTLDRISTRLDDAIRRLPPSSTSPQ